MTTGGMNAQQKSMNATITANVLQIAEGGEYEAKTLKIVQMLNRSTTVHFSTKPPLLAMCCYKPFFFTN